MDYLWWSGYGLFLLVVAALDQALSVWLEVTGAPSAF
jgi:hypothetical protein